MLDEQHGDAGVTDLADQLEQVLLLGRVEAGRRLVQAEQLGLGGQRPGDLEPALVAVGQVAGQLVGAVRDPDELAAASGRPAVLLLQACRNAEGLANDRAGARGAGEPALTPAAPPFARPATGTAHRTLVLWCASAPTMTFSIAVISGKSRMFWNVRARPILVIL